MPDAGTSIIFQHADDLERSNSKQSGCSSSFMHTPSESSCPSSPVMLLMFQGQFPLPPPRLPMSVQLEPGFDGSFVRMSPEV